MSEQAYCYHCRRYHPREDMRQVKTNGRQRWRCHRSLVSIRASREERDAFGKAISAMNKHDVRRSLPHCVTELLGTE